jgi:hypothetical protein
VLQSNVTASFAASSRFFVGGRNRRIDKLVPDFLHFPVNNRPFYLRDCSFAELLLFRDASSRSARALAVLESSLGRALLRGVFHRRFKLAERKTLSRLVCRRIVVYRQVESVFEPPITLIMIFRLFLLLFFKDFSGFCCCQILVSDCIKMLSRILTALISTLNSYLCFIFLLFFTRLEKLSHFNFLFVQIYISHLQAIVSKFNFILSRPF